MRRDEIDTAADWAAAEGWNPGQHDATCFHAADAGGFLVGLLDDEPVATISVVRYGDSFGFLGFYIVRPDQRGRGFGLQLWKAGMARLAGRTVGLDGVIAQQDNYRQSGFVLAHRNIRHEGVANGHAEPDANIVPLASRPWAEVTALDQRMFGTARDAFLRAWVAQPGTTALGLVQGGALRGYGVVRPCRTGHKIGPLFADSAEAAGRLFTALQAQAPKGTPVILDTPEVNADALALAHRHGMRAVFETARMYAGPAPQLPLTNIYGITSFELG